MRRNVANRIAGALCALIVAAMVAGTAWAISYLKSDDKVILNDGTAVVGSIIFRADTMVVIMIDGEERHIAMKDVKRIEMAEDVSGMVETTDEEEPEEAEAGEDTKVKEREGEKPAEGGERPDAPADGSDRNADSGTPAPASVEKTKDDKDPGPAKDAAGTETKKKDEPAPEGVPGPEEIGEE